MQYSELRIEIHASPETNDHEVHFIADGVDIIARYWDDMMGLDPDDILVEPCELLDGASQEAVTGARCICGVIGCGSVEVEIQRSEDYVVWEYAVDSPSRQSLRISFLAEPYDAEVERALRDHSWETPDRTAARLLASMVKRDILAQHHLSFLVRRVGFSRRRLPFRSTLSRVRIRCLCMFRGSAKPLRRSQGPALNCSNSVPTIGRKWSGIRRRRTSNHHRSRALVGGKRVNMHERFPQAEVTIRCDNFVTIFRRIQRRSAVVLAMAGGYNL